jgi:hypothetical protein
VLALAIDAAAEAAAGLLGAEHPVARQLTVLAGEVRRLQSAAERRGRIFGAVGRYMARRSA